MKPKLLKPAATPSLEPAFFSPQVAEAKRFYLDLNPERDQPLSVVCGGLEHCTSDYAIRRSTFPFYSIEYVTRGSGQLKLRGNTLPLGAGTVFAYGPGVAHEIRGDPTSPLVKYFVDFSGRTALRLLKDCQLVPGQAARIYPPSSLAALFDELIQCGLRGGQANSRLCTKLLECLALKINATNAPLKGMETLSYASYQQCHRHIEQHFLKLRTLEQIARACHADKAYLCRLFRRYDQQSPYQFLLRLKMNYAAGRLQQSSVLVKQVAEETGFTDPFHFSRVFRSVLGISPAAFRNLR